MATYFGDIRVLNSRGVCSVCQCTNVVLVLQTGVEVLGRHLDTTGEVLCTGTYLQPETTYTVDEY